MAAACIVIPGLYALQTIENPSWIEKNTSCVDLLLEFIAFFSRNKNFRQGSWFRQYATSQELNFNLSTSIFSPNNNCKAIKWFIFCIKCPFASFQLLEGPSLLDPNLNSLESSCQSKNPSTFLLTGVAFYNLGGLSNNFNVDPSHLLMFCYNT